MKKCQDGNHMAGPRDIHGHRFCINCASPLVEVEDKKSNLPGLLAILLFTMLAVFLYFHLR